MGTSSDPTCRSTTPIHLSLSRTYSEIYRLEMRFLVLSLMVTVASAGPQIAFGAPKKSSSTTKAPANVNTRLGLLAGPVWQVDRGRTGDLGGGLCLRDPGGLRQ